MNTNIAPINYTTGYHQFISFSGGVESTTMCVLFGNKADAIFADTGFEHDLVYDQIDKVQNWCKKFLRENFTIHKVKSKYGTLPNRIIEQKFYPSFTARYCTREFKIEPIDDFLKQYKTEGCKLMIGLNYDEIDKRTGNHGNKEWIEISYPLAENKLTRNACFVILDKVGLRPEYPVYMKRGGCIGCYYKSVNAYKALALLNPNEFSIVEKLENDFNAMKKEGSMFFKILGDPKKPSMKQIREMAHNELFKPEEVYVTINDVTQCGVFCNR